MIYYNIYKYKLYNTFRGIMSNTGHFLCYQITFLFMMRN